MRKKHFAGVLMLTAAVALGTVSPAVLPNTAIEVRAGVDDYAFKDSESGAYANPSVAVTGDREVTITMSSLAGAVGSEQNKLHYAGFGTTVAKAIENASVSKTAVEVVGTETTKVKVTVPEGVAGKTVIVKASSFDSGVADADKIGGEMIADITTFEQLTPLTIGKNNENIVYKEAEDKQAKVDATLSGKLEYREEGSKGNWTPVPSTGDATVKDLFPAADALADGIQKTYEVRRKADTTTVGSTKFAGKVATIKIYGKKDYTREELEKLNFTFENATLKATDFTTLVPDTQPVTRAAADTVVYKLTSKGGNEGSEKQFKKEGISSLNVGDKVKIYSTAKKGEVIEFTVTQPEKPTIAWVKDQYKLHVATPSGASAKMYEVVKDEALKYTLTVAGSTKDVKFDTTVTPATIDVAGPGKYTLKVVPSDAAVKVNDHKATLWVASDASNEVEVKAVASLFDADKFNKIGLSVKDNKLVISAASIVGVKDKKVIYTYNNGTPVEVTTDTAIDLVDGTFVLKVKDDANFMKTVHVVGMREDDGTKVTKYRRYETADNLREAFRTTISNGAILQRKKGDPSFKTLTLNTSLKDGDYELKYKTASEAAVELKVDNTKEITYTIPSEVAIKIGKESALSNFRTPVIPGKATTTTPTTPATPDKKDEPKKDEPKKDEPKKDDSKDTTPSTNPSTTTETKKATAKAAKVSLKVTDKKVTSVLKKSGTKLVAKTVYKAAVKNNDGKAVKTTLKVKLSTKAKTVYVLDLKTGKTIKAAYKNGKVTFKTKKSIAKFVIVNKAAKK